MLGRTGVAPYGRRCSWAHSEGHIGVAHYGVLVGGPFQLRWQPIGRRCLWAYLGEVPTVISHYRENVGDLQYALKQGSKSWPSPVRLGRDRYDSV